MNPYHTAGSTTGLRPHRPHRPHLHSPHASLSAAQLAKALGGHREGHGWKACCPAHDDRSPSLAISDGDDGRLLVYCHSGCPQAKVIDALRSRGLWGIDVAYHPLRTLSQRSTPRSFERDPSRIAKALTEWNEATDAKGTLVEQYLRDARGLALPPEADLRFHPRLWHSDGVILPGMVALVTDCLSGDPIGIHKTFLTPEGEKAPVDPDRKMRGCCAGGVVRLTRDSEKLIVGEGIETTLSAMPGSSHAGWAAMSATGLKNLRLPKAIGEILIVVDGDVAGRDAAAVITPKLQRAGKRVGQLVAPDGYDLNDVLLGRITLPETLN